MQNYHGRDSLELLKSIEIMSEELLSQVITFCESERRKRKEKRHSCHVALSASAMAVKEVMKSFICLAKAI